MWFWSSPSSSFAGGMVARNSVSMTLNFKRVANVAYLQPCEKDWKCKRMTGLLCTAFALRAMAGKADWLIVSLKC